MSRYFTVVIRSSLLGKDTPENAREKVASVFSKELGYRLLSQLPTDRGCFWSWEKGSKLVTYIGLVNWGTLYRRVIAELLEDGALRLHYHFSWLTNVAILASAARDELGFLQKVFRADQFKVERLR